jgi:hypothetical protein
MTNILANYPALTVFNPKAFEVVNYPLDEDKGYCRVTTNMITIRAFPGDKYEYVRNFYFGEADGEYFCNPKSAMLTSSPQESKNTFGYELGDIVSVDGKNFKLIPAGNHNITLEEALN